MSLLFETVADLDQGQDLLGRRRYGVIEVVEGRLERITLRPFPKVVSVPGILLFGNWHHRHHASDRCLLYYNQPWRFPNYLAVPYVVSGRKTTLATICRVLKTLDRIAELKRSDALLCDVANWRLSSEVLARWGWESHCPSRWHRHYIKRFYGDYTPARFRLSPAADTQVGSLQLQGETC